MKKFVVAQVIWLAIMSAMVGAIHYQSAGLGNVAALAIWTLALLSLFAAAALVFGCAAIDKARSGETKEKGVDDLRKLVDELDKRSTARKAWGWLQTIILVATAAYAGLFATAMAYAITTGVVAFALMVARSTLQKLDAAAVA